MVWDGVDGLASFIHVHMFEFYVRANCNALSTL